MINFPTVPTKYLIDTISPSNSSFRVNNIERWPKNNDVADDLTPSDFGDTAYAVFKDLQNTKLELMEIDPTTISQTSISIRKRGLKFYGNTLIEDSDLQQTWRGGQTLVELGSNPPQQIERATEFEKTYITQTGHGFSIGDILKSNGNNNEYEKAQADNEANAEGALGIVVQIIDSDNFVMIQRGIVENGVPAEAPGTLLYLDPNTAGAMTTIEPNITKPLAIVIENGNKMVFDPGIGLGGSGGGAGSVSSNAINQTGHGFTQGDIIRVDSANTYTKAQADSAVNAEIVGIVTNVIDPDNFEYSNNIIDYTGSGIPSDTPGSAVFLDPSTPGAMTTTKPTNVGEVVKPLGVIVDSGAKMDFYPYIGHVIQPTGSVGGNKLDTNTNTITVANTTNELDLYATTIEANVLSSTNAVKGRLHFEDLDFEASGGADAATFQVKYNGFTFGTVIVQNNASVAVTNAKGYIDYELYADNSVSAQRGNVYAVVADAEDDTGATVNAFDDDNGAQDKSGLIVSIDNKDLTVDSTQDQTFNATITWNGASTGASATKTTAYLQVLTDNMTLDEGVVDVQEFISSGTWDKPTKGTWALVEEIGAGASGAGVQATGTDFGATAGTGGQYLSFMIPLSALGVTETTTIGVGGTSVNTTNGGANGNDGGDTTFGSWGTAKGGVGGSFDTSTNSVGSTSADNTGTGSFNELLKEADGDTSDGNTATPDTTWSPSAGGTAVRDASTYNTFAPGTVQSSGDSGQGGTAASGSGAQTANAGNDYGAGGGAAASDTDATSGKGADGFVRVTVF